MTDLRKMGGKEHAPLLDKDSFLSPVTQAACAISQLSNDAFRKGEIVSIAEAEEIIKGYGLAPSEGMNPRCPKCGSGLWITTEPSWAGKVICSSHCGFTAYPKRTEQHEHYYTFDHYAQFFALSPARSGEPSAPQTSAEPLKCETCGSSDPSPGLCSSTWHLQSRINAAAPRPVSGDAPKVEEVPLARKAAYALAYADAVTVDEMEAILRPYFSK